MQEEEYKKEKVRTGFGEASGFLSFFLFFKNKRRSSLLTGTVSIVFLGFGASFLSPNLNFNLGDSTRDQITQAPQIIQSPTINNNNTANTPSVLGEENAGSNQSSSGSIELPEKPELSVFNSSDWDLERGLYAEEGFICSRGRDDRPITAMRYKPGLSINEVMVVTFSIRKSKTADASSREPKIVLIYNDVMTIFPGEDPRYVEFNDFKAPQKLNKLTQSVDINKPMTIVFEPSRLFANKLLYKYIFKFISVDPEISTTVPSLGSFESFQDNEDQSLPQNFFIGLYKDACVHINTFDTGSRNPRVRDYPYFQ